MKLTSTAIVTLFLTVITLFFGVILSSSLTFATNNTDTVDEVNITVPISCTLEGTGMTSHNATINNGTYNSSIGETTMKAYCNDNQGFAIYAIGYTDNEDGKNVLTSSTLGNTYDIATGIQTSGDTSKWAMKLSTITNPTPTYPLTIQNSFDSFHNVPDDYTLVAKRTTGTDIGINAEGSTLKSTYQVFISQTQPAGIYTGQVKYTMVHPNTADLDLPISIETAYSKSGKQKYNGYYKMQEMSDSICSMVTLFDEASQTQLIDTRDNKVYYVAKLQDGNCWMTQNLDHDIVTTANYYTNENTDIGWNTSTNSYDVATWKADYATHTSGDGYWCDELLDPGGAICGVRSISSYDPGDYYWNGELSSSYEINEISSSGDMHYHLGNYYNWNAAVATNDSDSLLDGALMERSICPAGWTLPRAGVGPDSFYSLLDNYGFTEFSVVGDDAVWDAPLYFNLSGGIGSERLVKHDTVGLIGNYWSANFSNWDWNWAGDSKSGGYAYNLYFMGDEFHYLDTGDVDGGGVSIGKSVRCIARPVSNS